MLVIPNIFLVSIDISSESLDFSKNEHISSADILVYGENSRDRIKNYSENLLIFEGKSDLIGVDLRHLFKSLSVLALHGVFPVNIS